MNFLKLEEIILKFTYNSQANEELKFKINEKMINILKIYADKIGVDIDSLIFLYNGDKIENTEKELKDIINKEDKNRKEMNIVAYNIVLNTSVKKDSGDIMIIFSVFSKSIIKKECKRNEKMKNICFQFACENGGEFDSFTFKYLGKEIDFNKTFDQLANSYDIQCNGMTILVYKKHLLMVNFIHELDSYPMESYKEEKIKDIFSKYTLEKGLNRNNLAFKYNNIPINNLE